MSIKIRAACFCGGAKGLRGGMGTQRSVTQWTVIGCTAYTHALAYSTNNMLHLG